MPRAIATIVAAFIALRKPRRQGDDMHIIPGGTGHIGSALTDTLLEQGRAVSSSRTRESR